MSTKNLWSSIAYTIQIVNACRSVMAKCELSALVSSTFKNGYQQCSGKKHRFYTIQIVNSCRINVAM